MPVKSPIHHAAPRRLAFICAIMDLCWLNAWAYLMIQSSTNFQTPFLLNCLIFVLGYLTACFFRSRTVRLIWPALIHLLGAFAMIVFMLYRHRITNLPVSVSQWYASGLVLAFTLVFWIRGALLANRNLTYRFICRHFDLGFALFFVLWLITLLVRIKAGISLPDSMCFNLMLAFMISGPSALFIVSHPHGSDAGYIDGFKGYGILISISLILLLSCLVWGLAFHPLLTRIAESGTSAVQEAAGPFAPFLTSILRFLFAPRTMKGFKNDTQRDAGNNSEQIIPVGPDSTGDTIFLYGLMILLPLIAAGFTAFLLYRIAMWLLKKRSPVNIQPEDRSFIRLLLNYLSQCKMLLVVLIRMLTRKTDTAGKGFTRLIAWGTRSGIRRRIDETPLEYCSRLKNTYAVLGEEIDTIYLLFVREAFALKPPDPACLNQIKQALKRMHHPRFFWLRLKTVFMQH